MARNDKIPTTNATTRLAALALAAIAMAALLLLPAAGRAAGPESPATGRAAAPESTTADPEATVSARKRRRYPPARLWYRVNVQFHGEVDVPPGRVLELSEFEERWGLSSRTAIRLTLLCVDTREGEPEQPFAIKRRVRGKRRRVGGCPRIGPAAPPVVWCRRRASEPAPRGRSGPIPTRRSFRPTRTARLARRSPRCSEAKG